MQEGASTSVDDIAEAYDALLAHGFKHKQIQDAMQVNLSRSAALGPSSCMHSGCPLQSAAQGSCSALHGEYTCHLLICQMSKAVPASACVHDRCCSENAL